jgi:cyanophycin synthetase
MEIRKVLALRGPNLWATFPVLEAWVDLQELKDSPSNEIPGFNDRLMAWLPTMIEHRCSIGERGGFFQRLRNGTWQGHILEHVTLELQSLAGSDVGYGRARETSEEGVYRVIVEYQEETLGREALETARRLLDAAVYNKPFDVSAEVARLRELAHAVCLGPSTKSIVDAAVERGIPVRRLNTGSLVQLGYGRAQRKILAAETDRTGAIAQEIAQDKELTRQLLAEAGIPVPHGRPVDSAEDAWRAAEEIGVPVVVKPRDGNQGRGVALNLSTREQVHKAYEAAKQESSSVMVEKFVGGKDYRLLVVGTQLVAAARREPAQVVGDGRNSVTKLIDIVNLDPRRGDDHATVLSKIRLDAVSLAVLAEQGLTPDSVPAKDQIVLIRRNANLSTGGTAVDVTDEVHPEIRNVAVEAAQVVGLDLCGIDVVTADISRPLLETCGVIVEVNAGPGLRMHLSPSEGKSRPVGKAIIDMMFPAGESGRIPIVAVTGVNGKTTTTRFIAHILRGTGKCVGLTSTDGIWIGDRQIDGGDCSGPKSARAVLAHPKIDLAVFETARGGILREGLGFDQCDVAVVTNIGQGDHLGLSDVDTLEKLAQVKRCIVETVPKGGTAVLNAADPLVAAMAEKCAGNVVFFALSSDQSVLASHRERGGRTVFVRDRSIVLATGDYEIPILSVDRVPLTHGGRVSFQVENTLAAIAAAWTLGIPAELIRVRAETFVPNLDLNPGRFNIIEINGTTVVVDYGHNVSALQALIDALRNFPQQRRVIVYSTAGDRRNVDFIEQGRLLGAHFDKVYLYEGDYCRNRAPGEIMSLLTQGLSGAPRAKEVHSIQGHFKAVDTALAAIKPDELLVIQADVVDDTVQYLRQRYGVQTPRDFAVQPSMTPSSASVSSR